MTLKLEVGKCYVRGDGEITGPLEANETFQNEYLNRTYRFIDPRYLFTYTEAGKILDGTTKLGPDDLVSEYKVKELPDLIAVPNLQIWT